MSEINARNIDTENSEYAKTYLTDNEDKYLLDNVGVYLITDYKKEDDIMATKKYVSIEKLGLYDEKIKGVISAGDAAALQEAKDYADGLASNYDAVGTAATEAGKVQAKLDAEAATARAAEEANAAAAKKAQDEVDALELVVDTKAAAADLAALAGKVGEVPENETVMGIINNIQENAYNDTELRNLISGLSTNKADKTQVATDIENAVKAEADARAQAIAGVQGAVDALSGTHATDKKALEDAIALKADKAAFDEANETLAAVKKDVDDFFANALGDTDAQQVKDTLKELQEYIASDESGAATMAGNIKQNADDIDALEGRMGTAEGKITTAEGKIASLEGAVATKVEQEAYNTKIGELAGADTALDERLQEIEAKFKEGEGSVEDMISDAVEAEALRVDGELAKKVDKVDGKGLSTNDLTNELKGQYDAAYAHSQVAHAPANAQENVIETVKVNGSAVTVTGKAVDITVPTNNAQLENGAGYLVAADIANKADKATTLAGYGITDAYTTAQVDSAIATAVGQFVECSEQEILDLFA